MYESIFSGGTTRLREMFDKLPAKAQKALLATAFRDFESPETERIIGEIQQSIVAYNSLMDYELFRDASNLKKAQEAVEAWTKQYAFDEVTGEPYHPSEKFSNFALALASMFKGDTQKHIQAAFNRMYDLIQGRHELDMIDIAEGKTEADYKPVTLSEAIAAVLGIEYKPISKQGKDNGKNRSDVLGGNPANGERGRRGVTGDASDGERDKIEEQPADGRGRAAGVRSEGKAAVDAADPLAEEALRVLDEKGLTTDEAGRNALMRHFKIGYNRATRLIEAVKALQERKKENSSANDANTSNMLFSYFAGTLSEMIAMAKRSAKGLVKKIIAPVSDRLQKDLAEEGINVTSAYNHVIDNNAIRHALKAHGGPHEEKRGQVPITDADLALIEDIVAHYDNISVNAERRDVPRIIYSKSYEDGTTIYVEEQRTGRKELAAVTMWKMKKATLTDAKSTETPQISDLNSFSEGKGSDFARDKQEIGEESLARTAKSDVEAAEEATYTIERTTYTNKKGKTSDVYLVKFGRELTTEERASLDAYARGRLDEGRKKQRGWWDRERGGYMMRSEEAARRLGEMLGDRAGLADERPLSAEELREAVSTEKASGKAEKSPINRVNVESLTAELKDKGEAKLSDHVEGRIDKAKEQEEYEISDDEAQALADELRDLLGIGDDEGDREIRFRDPGELTSQERQRVQSAGIRLAMGLIERGSTRFDDYAMRMVGMLGDKIRPWLKSFYEGARWTPGYEKYDFTPSEDVARFDVANFDKRHGDVIAQAEMITEERKASQVSELAQQELKDMRNNKRAKRRDERAKRSADTAAVASKGAAVASEAESDAEVARVGDEASLEAASGRIDASLDEVNNQLAILGHFADNDATVKVEARATAAARALAGRLIDDLGLKPDDMPNGVDVVSADFGESGGVVRINLPIGAKYEPLRIELRFENTAGSGLRLAELKTTVKRGDRLSYIIGEDSQVWLTAPKYGELLDVVALQIDKYVPKGTGLGEAAGVAAKEKRQKQTASSPQGQDLTTGSASVSDVDMGTKLLISNKHAVKSMLKILNGKYIGIKRTHGFLSDINTALGAGQERKPGQTHYYVFKTDDGATYTLRISNHNVNATNHDGKTPEISIVIKSRRHPNRYVGSEVAEVTEFVYFKEDIANGDGHTLSWIVYDLSEMLDTGVYKDTSRLAKVNRSTGGERGGKGVAIKRDEPIGRMFGAVGDEAATVPTLVVPEARPVADLMGDSAAYQDRVAQTAELVGEIGGVIENRVLMLQIADKEQVTPLTMTEVKRMASNYPALKGISDTDLQELVELAMTQLTRSKAIAEIAGTAEQQRVAFEHIVNLYHMQPSLNARDSERLMKQQYSTPTPFGYVMGQFVRAGGKPVGSMLEPSAGNGALTITVDPRVVHVNDIDDARLANLRKLGYGMVTAQDALLPFGGEQVDVVMTNPPFGTVTEKVYDGIFHVSSLEGQMAINALEKMKDDGRAAIVIGGNTSYRTNGSMNPKDAAFFGYLYSHYNVVDVINISGKTLYSRNGTGYDVRMILIDGRKAGDFRRVFPPVKAKARAEQVTTFEELYKRVQDDIQQIQQVGHQADDVQRGAGTTVNRAEGTSIRSGNNRADAGAGQRPGSAGDVVGGTRRADVVQSVSVDDGGGAVGLDNGYRGDAAGVNDVSRTKSASAGRGELDKGVGAGRGRVGNDGRNAVSTGFDAGGKRLAVKTELGDEKIPYPNQSGNGFTLMSVVPAAQARVLQKSLGEIGDVDRRLVDELGYSSEEELYGYLAAEQIDSVALAIHQMNKGNAFIIGNMTGVGKGRQGAALIRYAVKQGKIPIYFTQKPALFLDNYRDLVDIGSVGLRPFIMASVDKERTGDIVDASGKVIYKIPSKKEKERVYKYILETGKLPSEYGYVLTTYSQIQNGTSDYEQNSDGTWSTGARKVKKNSKGYTSTDYNGQMRRLGRTKANVGRYTHGAYGYKKSL